MRICPQTCHGYLTLRLVYIYETYEGDERNYADANTNNAAYKWQQTGICDMPYFKMCFGGMDGVLK